MKQEERRYSPPVSFESVGQCILWHRLHLGLSQEALAEEIGASARSLRRWERDLVVPQKIWRERLAFRFGIEPQQLLPAGSDESEEHSPISSPLWTVPYPRNPCFIGRETVLHTLHTVLAATPSAAQARTLAISGLGGIGKTQVAIEYAYRHQQDYHAVFWLAAETAESLLASLGQIADLLQLPGREVAEQSRLIAATRRWLATHEEWLVIADNVDDPGRLYEVLPPLRQGALLLTTRSQALGTLAPVMDLPSMNEEESIALLFSRARPSFGTPEAARDAAIVTQARELARFLEGLPLALDQAGAYLQETGCSVAAYLQRCHEQRKDVLARRGMYDESHPASVTTTVQLSVDRIAREHPAAPNLLCLCAFLYPEAIPEELLMAGAPHLGPELGPILTDPYQFDLVLAAVRSASLIARAPETKTLSLHRLVQGVLRDQMEPDETRRWSEWVVRMLNAAFPPVTFAVWAQCERYIVHVLACLPLLEQLGNTLPEAGEVLFKAGSYLLARGRLGEAEPLLERAVTLAHQVPRGGSRVLLGRLEKLADLYWMQGKYDQGEQLLLQALVLEEEEWSASHPCTGETLNNLAVFYRKQGKHEQAESLYMRALENQEQAAEPSFPHLADTLNNLGVLYYGQGKYEQAEALYQRALAIREQYLGPEHPDTAASLNTLGLLYWMQWKYEQAEPLLKRALAIREQQLGPEHPDIGASLNNLAAVYWSQKNYEQAEPLYLRALAVHEQHLGPDHPDTAASLNNLANLYRDQGRDEQAEALHLRALAIREQHLGPDHPDTALSVYNLAVLYRKQGKHKQSEPLFVRALTIREQYLGPEHPSTAISLQSVAILRQEQGDTIEAQALFTRALQIRIQVLGSGHPRTRETRARLADLLRVMGKTQEALALEAEQAEQEQAEVKRASGQ